MPHDRALDIVVFGATGFTGGLVAEYLAKQSTRGSGLRWALAGRDAQKLARVRDRIDAGANGPELVVADATDPQALRELARRTRVVLTTVGPYLKYGEPLVAACAENGTHYVDLTGEPTFVERIRAKYHARAVETGAKIVNSCGFDSIPHDLGAYFTLQALRRRLSEEEQTSAPVTIEGVVRARGTISGGTWHSALEIMATLGEALARDRRARDQARGAARKVRPIPPFLRYRRDLGLWLLPMPTIDPQVVLASARLLPEYGPDFHYGHYLGLRHFYQVTGLMTLVGTLATVAQLPPARALLGRLRKPGEGPDEATRKKSWFRVAFLGRAGRHTVRCEVRGGDPGYGETSKMIAEAALALALDEDRLPPHVGIVPPAAAIGNVLIDRLVRAGITFEEQSAEGARAASSRVRQQPIAQA